MIQERAFQEALAQILVDDELRQTVFERNHPISHGLDERILEQLRVLDALLVSTDASMLREKRIYMVTRPFPGTLSLLTALNIRDRTMWDFCRRCPPLLDTSQRHRTLKDAELLSTYLIEKVAVRTHVPYFRDIVVFEHMRLKMSFDKLVSLAATAAWQGGRPKASKRLGTDESLLKVCPRIGLHATILFFSFDVPKIIRQLRAKQGLPPATPSKTRLLMYKEVGSLLVRVVRLGVATAHILSLCDGVHSLEEIIMLADSYGDREETLAFLRRVRRQGIVVF